MTSHSWLQNDMPLLIALSADIWFFSCSGLVGFWSACWITAAMAFRHLEKWGIHLSCISGSKPVVLCAPGQMKPWIFRGDSGVLTTMLLAHIWCSHADMYLNSRRLSAVKHLDGSSEAAIGYPTPEVREDRITSFASRATMCRDLSLPRCVSDVKQSRWDSANTLCTCTFRTHMYMFLHASWAWRNANRLFDSQNNAASGAWHWLGERKNWDMWASRIV